MTDILPLLPRVYCASPLHRSHMWQTLASTPPFTNINIVSTWHNNNNVENEEDDPAAAFIGWHNNLRDIKWADHILAYAEFSDKPNGTLFELGYAHSIGRPIHLVGNFKWGTWRLLPSIHHHDTFRDAIDHIVHSKEFASNDPT